MSWVKRLRNKRTIGGGISQGLDELKEGVFTAAVHGRVLVTFHLTLLPAESNEVRMFDFFISQGKKKNIQSLWNFNTLENNKNTKCILVLRTAHLFTFILNLQYKLVDKASLTPLERSTPLKRHFSDRLVRYTYFELHVCLPWYLCIATRVELMIQLTPSRITVGMVWSVDTC